MTNKVSIIFHYSTIILLLNVIILLLFLLLFFLLFYYYFIWDYYFTIIFTIILYYCIYNILFCNYFNYFSLQVPIMWEPVITHTGPVHRDPADYCIQKTVCTSKRRVWRTQSNRGVCFNTIMHIICPIILIISIVCSGFRWIQNVPGQVQLAAQTFNVQPAT